MQIIAPASACRHLQVPAGICKHLQASASACRHLQASAGICKRLQASARTCYYLPVPASIPNRHIACHCFVAKDRSDSPSIRQIPPNI